MKIFVKLFFALGIALLLAITIGAGAVLYFSHHPDSLKSYIEKSVSSYIGATLTIQEIDATLRPATLRAEGIIVSPANELQGVHLRLAHASVEIAFKGPFGNKTLLVKNLELDGMDFQVTSEMKLPFIDRPPKAQSFMNQAFNHLISYFFFKNVLLDSAKINNGRIEAKTSDQILLITHIQGAFDVENQMKMSCNMEMKWPSKNTDFHAPAVQLSSNTFVSLLNPEIRCHVSLDNANFLSPIVSGKGISLKSDLLYTHSDKKLFFAQIDLLVEKLIPNQKASDSGPHFFHIKTGVFDLPGKHLKLSHWNLNLNGMADIHGALDVQLGDSPLVTVDRMYGEVFPGELMPLIYEKKNAGQTPISLSGPVRFHGKMNGFLVQDSWRWQGEFKTEFKQNDFSYGLQKPQMTGRISGEFELKGKYPDMEIAAHMHLNDSSIYMGDVRLQPTHFRLTLTGNQLVFKIEDLSIGISKAEFGIGSRPIVLNDIRLDIQKGTIDFDKGIVFVPTVQMDSALLKNIQGLLEIDGGALYAEIKGGQTHLSKLLIANNVLPSQWQMNANDTVRLAISQKRKDVLSVSSHLEFTDLAFQNPDSSRVGEKLWVKVKMDTEIDFQKHSMDAHTTIQVQKGEVLLDRFYLNLGENGFSATSDLRYDISQKALHIESLGVHLEHIMDLRGQGALVHAEENQQFQFSVDLLDSDIKAIYRHLLLEPFQMEKPVLRDLTLAGRTFAELELKKTDHGLMAAGHWHWHHGSLINGEMGLILEDINLDFPVIYQTENTQNSSKVLLGRIEVKSITLPPFLNQPLSIELEAAQEKLSIKAPTVLSIPGGNIHVGPIIAENLFSPDASISTSVRLKNFELNPILTQMGTRPINGIINTRIDPLSFEKGTLTGQGNMEIDLFDGRITLSNLRANDIFTTAPVIKIDMKIDDLSLEKMTEGTSFGRIEGVLGGTVKNLEIAQGQPQRFNLLLETEKKKGISQKVSVRAVDNIARIGGSQSPFMGLAGQFATLFDEFGYKKMGMRADLENDVFRINGTIKEGGTEYIMIRKGLPGVSIVNHQPDNQVSFKDMVKRIKRIYRDKRNTTVNKP